MRRCRHQFGAVRVGEIVDLVEDALNNAHWAREGLEELGRRDLAVRLDDALEVLRELNTELAAVRGG